MSNIVRRKHLVIFGGVFTVVFVGVLVYILAVKPAIEKKEATEGLAVAPEFSLPDAEGNMFSLRSVESDVTVVNFWASWSPYSKDELSALVQLKKEYGDKVTVVALNRDANPNDGKEYLESLALGNDLLFVYDTNDEYFRTVKGFAVPETLFLIENEHIHYHQHGPMTYDEMKAQVDTILAL